MGDVDGWCIRGVSTRSVDEGVDEECRQGV